MTASDDVPRDPFSPSEQPAGVPLGDQPPPGYGGHASTTTPVERNWAVVAHAGSIVTAMFGLGLLAPLFVLLGKGSDSAFVRRQAVESLNFQINALIYIAAGLLLMLVLIGFVLLPLYGLLYLVCVVLASMRASQGEDFRYPLTMRFVA
jgi:uncharacterized protein